MTSSAYFTPLPLYGSGAAARGPWQRSDPGCHGPAEVENRRLFLSTLAVTDLGQHEDDRVRVAERHRQLVARDLGAVTDAVDLQLAGPASVTPLTMLARCARTRPCLARSSRESRPERPGTSPPRPRCDAGGERLAELALGPLIP